MSGEAGDDRNWYKIATIILAAMMVVLTFLSVVYFRFVDTRRTEIDAISSKIIGLTKQRGILAKIPRVTVEISTLKDSGLPESAFAPLSTVPAVITLKHSGGETARGITLLLSSETVIAEVRPDASVETFSNEISEDGLSVLFEIPQLRNGSSVRATIMQRGLGAIAHATRIDTGKLVDQDEKAKGDSLRSRRVEFGEGDLLRFLNRRNAPKRLSLSEVRDITPESFSEIALLDQAIGNLKELRREIETRPLISLGSRSSLLASLLPALLLAASVTVLLSIAVAYFDHRMQRRAADALRSRTIHEGMKTSEVEAALGRWSRNKYSVSGDADFSECWVYQPHQRFLFIEGFPGCIILVSDDAVQRVTYLEASPHTPAAQHGLAADNDQQS